MIPVLTAADRRKLEAAGLIVPPVAAPITAPKVLRPRPHKANASTIPKRGGLSEAEARATCICIECRTAPAKFFGPGLGYGARCPRCTVEVAARNARRRAERG